MKKIILKVMGETLTSNSKKYPICTRYVVVKKTHGWCVSHLSWFTPSVSFIQLESFERENLSG